MSLSCKVCYAGTFADYSGYGECNRNDIMALSTAGVEVTTELTGAHNKTADYGKAFEIARSLKGKDIDYRIKILHCTPDLYARYKRPCLYHIGRFMWETDRLSREWTWYLNNECNEVWTATEYHRNIFKKSGVKRPIIVIPEAIDIEMVVEKPFLLRSKGVPVVPQFLFYSIFQWIERKDWKTLLIAYLTEFENEANVALLIKTYREFFTPQETYDIFKDIYELKDKLNINNPPDIYLCIDLLTKHDVFKLHKTGDCFVLPHRGEGWNIPITEALLMSKPVIATNLGGVHEYLTEEHYYPLKHEIVDIFNMEWAPQYGKDHKWAQVDINDLKRKMRFVYYNRMKAKKKALKGKAFVKKNFNYEVVGGRMRQRLEEIEKEQGWRAK